jgi:hypothetical protein
VFGFDGFSSIAISMAASLRVRLIVVSRSRILSAFPTQIEQQTGSMSRPVNLLPLAVSLVPIENSCRDPASFFYCVWHLFIPVEVEVQCQRQFWVSKYIDIISGDKMPPVRAD